MPIGWSYYYRNDFFSIGTLSMCKYPQILFIRPSKTDRIMSCPPPVFPSVNFRVRTITDTVQDIFMKLGTNINHYQTSAENKNRYSISIFMELWLFEFFLMKIVSLHNFDTVQNIFMKLCTNINHHQTMCRKKES